jgi:FtsP/CotA-like multicopper oxidase with cupredoxin domain
MWTYGGTYPGLTIRRPTGQTTRLTFANNLPDFAGGKTVHHHGNHSASADDGQVSGIAFLFDPSQSRTYTYEGTEGGQNERGALQWYHDHRMGETGMTVWMGLAGLYILDDPADPASLPSGACELPLVIADRQFDADNQIQYFYDAAGVVGDKVLVNGVYQPFLDVADRKYRLRILNGANARIYILTLSTGGAMTQIGTESGLLPVPVSRTALDFGPAERLDVVVDFAGKLGQEIYLMDASQMVPLLKFRVTQHATDTSTVPTTLRALPDIGQPTVTRNFSFDFTSNHWTINRQRFDPDRIDAKPVLGTTEKWIFTNPTGSTHMVHIHDVDQQCVSRDGGACYPWETMKETWSVGPGETLEVKMKFTDHTGVYMLHCHILEHEDDGMMTKFEVVAPATSNKPLAPTLNISTRSNVLGGDNNLIAGFIVTGSESKRVALRAIGPALVQFLSHRDRAER